MAEIELNVHTGQCLNRRIDNIEEVKKDVNAWQEQRNNKNSKVNWHFTAFFVLDEQSSSSDPYIYVIQPGIDWKIADAVSLKFAAAYYGTEDLQGELLDNSRETNTLSGGGLAFEYSSYGVSAQLAVKQIAGILLGHEKIGNLWDWQLSYSYRRLEKNAWLDILPDSDFFGGATGVKGHEAIVNLGLAKNIWLGFDYYHSENIENDGIEEDLFQADLNLKF